jgi:hypothetical protein
MNNLATAYQAAGQLDLALPLFQETLAKMKAKLGANHPYTLTTAGNLGHAYCQQGQYGDAEPLLALWLDKVGRKLPTPTPTLALRLNLLGTCRVALKQYAAAEAPLRDSLAIYLKFQPKGVLRYDTESLLGAALAGQEKDAEAEPLLTGSAKVLLASAAKLSPANQKLAAAAAQRVIDFYAARGNADEAARWRQLRDQAFAPPK